MTNDRELYQEGRSLMDAGAFDQAAVVLSQSATARPHFKTLELLGECYTKLGRFQEAVPPLTAAVALNMQSRAAALLAEVFEKLGDRDDAIAMARTALERSPDNKRAQRVIERL